MTSTTFELIRRVLAPWLRAVLALLMLTALLHPLPAAAHSEGALDSPRARRAAPIEHPVIDDLRTDLSVEGLRFHYPHSAAGHVAPLLREAPQIRDRILADLAPDALPEVDIYLLPTIEHYFTARGIPARSPHWASGLALMREDVILIRLEPAAGGRLELDRTLGHELSHIALHHYTQDRHLPTWFVEGFAVFQTETWGMKRAERLVQAGLNESVQPLRDFERGFPRAAAAATLAYAESAHFLYWLDERYGRDQLRVLLKGLNEGRPFEMAFFEAYERPFGAVEADWRETLEVPYGWVPDFLTALVALALITLILGLFFWRVRRRRAHDLVRLAQSSDYTPTIPNHLRNFGPFTSQG